MNGNPNGRSERPGALEGIRVLDLTRLAPGPYCTMLLADMGADVIVVGGGSGSLQIPALARGKRFIDLDLKSAHGLDAFRRLAATADVVVEGYRPGVTARLGIDERKMRGLNPRLVYCSLTGYGQSGPLASDAGHDLNYIAIAGALGAFGPAGDVPSFPLNLLADFAGGSLFAAFGIVLALYARKSSGEGQYIDASMVDGSMSMMAMHFADWGNAVLPARGEGLLAGTAPCYRCYHCKDGRFVSVAALERRFFETLWATLGYPQPAPDHFDRVNWPSLTERFEATFAERSRDEWAAIFAGRDACVTPVLDPGEAMLHPHNRSRHPHLSAGSVPVAPLLSETPGAASPVDLADQTIKVLRSVGLTEDEARQARTSTTSGNGTGLAWPPV